MEAHCMYCRWACFLFCWIKLKIYLFLAYASENNRVFAWGDNSFGQLGIMVYQKPESAPASETNSCSTIKTSEHSLMAQKLPSTSASSKGKRVIIRGSTQKKKAAQHALPQLIEGLEGKQIDKVLCGWSFTIAVSGTFLFSIDIALGFATDFSLFIHPSKANRDQLYSFGRNNYGQLGLGDTANRFTPTLVQSELLAAGIARIACGSEHTLVLTGEKRI